MTDEQKTEDSVEIRSRLMRGLPGVLLGSALLIPFFPGAGEAQPTTTTVRVRVVSHDAKIIGSGVGGARVTVRHAATGRVMAQGTQEGSTGDTDAIVVDPVERGGTVYDTPGAAHYDATLELTEPTRVVIEARGPLGTPHAVQEASMTTLLIPGRDVLGEGFILKLHGFTVEVQTPTRGARFGDSELPVRVRVTMLCGCPIRPGGLWDANRVEVTAVLLRNGRPVARTPLSFGGEASIFQGALPAVDGGADELQVLASDPARANFGMASVSGSGG